MDIPRTVDVPRQTGNMSALRRWRWPLSLALLGTLGLGLSLARTAAEFPTSVFGLELPLPIVQWVDNSVDYLVRNLRNEVFLPMRDVILRGMLVPLEDLLHWLPWWLIVGGASLLAWGVAGRRVAYLVIAGLLFIGMFGLWDKAMTTLAVVGTATLIALWIAIPIGILMAKSDIVGGIVRPVLDLLQTMPSFVYLIPAIMLLGPGKVPAVLATVLYAAPPAIRLTNLGIRLVPPEITEAARAFGTSNWQLLLKVQLPLARPNIMAGVNQTIMMALAMAVLASMIGARGLGSEILGGIERLEMGRALVAGLSIVLLAVMIDRVSGGLAKSGHQREEGLRSP